MSATGSHPGSRTEIRLGVRAHPTHNPHHAHAPPTSPDHAYYQQAAERLGANRACLAIARKLLKRSYHTLRELGEEALQPA